MAVLTVAITVCACVLGAEMSDAERTSDVVMRARELRSRYTLKVEYASLLSFGDSQSHVINMAIWKHLSLIHI